MMIPVTIAALTQERLRGSFDFDLERFAKSNRPPMASSVRARTSIPSRMSAGIQGVAIADESERANGFVGLGD